ncbi:Uncharacterized SAM-binding protein YcdF, DUF218 family [Tindallia magadiensis]|uniref:Uncharacterized SAM-binding protein YcdF, DUF218 family n=2 Tax=Tindallia magadiensis TaxID=69895 RepID=A0A1I3FBM2_9FIRM|nr:Uncharacterized SAM-binding protein YcdF, DUF218 family [Tindallia magadiensis]
MNTIRRYETGFVVLIAGIVYSVMRGGWYFESLATMILGLAIVLFSCVNYLFNHKILGLESYPKVKKGCLVLTWMFFTVIGVFFMVQLMIMGTFIMAGNDQADYAVVLGAGIIRREPSYTLAKRLDYAAKYLEDNPSGMLITSGGKSDGQLASEAEVMMWYLEKKGISADRIILEEKSTNTLENIKYSMNHLNQKNDAKVTEIVIITSDYHLLRAQMIARRLGFDAYGIPAQSPPSLYWHYSLRESVAIFKSMLLDW